eukprot:scaffold8437_cov99-Isochrysis_galbana.AAC.6
MLRPHEGLVALSLHRVHRSGLNKGRREEGGCDKRVGGRRSTPAAACASGGVAPCVRVGGCCTAAGAGFCFERGLCFPAGHLRRIEDSAGGRGRYPRVGRLLEQGGARGLVEQFQGHRRVCTQEGIADAIAHRAHLGRSLAPRGAREAQPGVLDSGGIGRRSDIAGDGALLASRASPARATERVARLIMWERGLAKGGARRVLRLIIVRKGAS